MSIALEVKFSLKVMINKEKTKVLFAEADSDFMDVLLSFLTLPLGRIVRILKNHHAEAHVRGSLTTLYNGIANLEGTHSHDTSNLLYPTSSSTAECCELKLSIDGTAPTKYKKWVERENKRKRSASVTKGTKALKTQAADVGLGDGDGDGDAGAFTVNTASFMISDDLLIAPVVPGSIVQTLINLGITCTDGAELRAVTLGLNEIMDLLKGSLLSETPLTDTILQKSSGMNCVTADLLHRVEKIQLSNSKDMIVNAVVQKSTNKVLFAEAEEKFIDFIFSFLAIPLGAVECLLGGETSLKNIDNLYRSIAVRIDDKFFVTKDTKAMLLGPKLPYFYISKDQILPLVEEGLSSSYQKTTFPQLIKPSIFKEGFGKYVNGPATYMVTDDLTVTPFCLSSSVSTLNKLKVPLSDVKEIELHIGVEEALSILKASLTSTSALTNGLANRIFEKKIKETTFRV